MSDDRPVDEEGKPVDRRRNWFARLLEDPSGIPDDARIHAGLVVLTFLGATLYSVYRTGEFHAQDWGIGCGAMCVGLGAWFGIRKGN